MQTICLTVLNFSIISAAIVAVTSIAWYLGYRGNRKNRGYRQIKRQTHVLSVLTRQHTFLEAIKTGDIESAIQYGEEQEIAKFMAVITAILAEIPFGVDVFKQELICMFEQKCDTSTYLMESFLFFLYSYFNEHYVRIIWSKHETYQSIFSSDMQFSEKKGAGAVSRFRSRSKPKKPKTDFNVNCKDLKLISKQRQRRMLRRLYEQLTAEAPLQKKKFLGGAFGGKNAAEARKCSFNLPETIQLSENRKKAVSVDELNYEGHNILQLFEIFSFKYNDDERGNKECKSADDEDDTDDIHEAIQLNISSGFRVHVGERTFCDPINGRSGLSLIQVERTFNSNAKPILLNLFCGDTLSSQMIFKKGDDLRKDASILMMFDLFNDIWKYANLRYHGADVNAFTYKCIPMGPDYGCIEYVPDCVPLTDVLKKYGTAVNDAFIHKLVASSVGSYIASYVMGVRDRHSDNILIRSDGTLFHIDFGYVLGEKLSGLDASKFAITTDFETVLGDKAWNEFVSNCVAAFGALRDHYVNILAFAKVSLKFLEWKKIETFLMQKLMIGADSSEVEKWMRDKINKAPKQWKTKMKNTIHSIAVNVKK